jgi:tripartite-type tricarboxylate transporter receptor subunit TctC
VQELLGLARAKPGGLNYASAGAGSSLHMTGELFKHAAGVNIVHVAYKGTGPALVDLLAGQVQMIFSTMPPVLPHVKTGRLRALGVTTAARAKAAPDVPTIAESGVALQCRTGRASWCRRRRRPPSSSGSTAKLSGARRPRDDRGPGGARSRPRRGTPATFTN